MNDRRNDWYCNSLNFHCRSNTLGQTIWFRRAEADENFAFRSLFLDFGFYPIGSCSCWLFCAYRLNTKHMVSILLIEAFPTSSKLMVLSKIIYTCPSRKLITRTITPPTAHNSDLDHRSSRNCTSFPRAGSSTDGDSGLSIPSDRCVRQR